MVSLGVMKESNPDSFPTDSDLLGMGRQDAIERVVEWFFHNFEDPVHNAPYDSGEGGYQYIWGGPYGAIDELQARFGRDLSDDVIQAALEEIEEGGGPEWTVSSRRVTDEDNDGYRADLTNDSPPWFLEERAREQVSKDLAAFEAALDRLPIAAAGIGHNKPPEPLDDFPLSDDDMEGLRATASGTRLETSSARPNVQKLSVFTEIILAWTKKVAIWTALKADQFAENAVKSAGTATGAAVIGGIGLLIAKYVTPEHATLIDTASKFAASLLKWIPLLIPGI
jgi:hypothetical protein